MDEKRNFDEFIEEEKNPDDYLVEENHNQEVFRSEIENEEYKIPQDIIISREKDDVEENKVKKKRKRSFRGSLISYIALALVSSIIGGVASIYIAPILYGKVLPNPNNTQYVSSTPINIVTNDDINTVSAVAKKAMSSVVGITTVEVQQLPFPFFSSQEVEGVGSGVIVDSNGYILTNSHVVADGKAKSVHVLFENGEKKPGTVLWNDSLLDLAIVKVDATNLPVADLGDSDKLEVGEIVVAIGNPLGLEFQRTVTSGIISGLHRSIRVSNNNVIEDLIQTDASINPGNSGGPLLNSKGEVIGINTAKIKSAEGLGFSIPINQAKAIVEEVIEHGKFQTVVLGITGASVEDYQRTFGVKLPVEKGVVLLQVHEDTPAYESGLLIGDIITKIDDTSIENMNQLKKALYKYKQGDKAKLTINRTNTVLEIEVVFKELK
ncbi:MAG: trypsin-like serine protease [Tissierellia bacterium]|nr:trypsin-like serine protease [Tissierellia bacterium]